jgi:hypothetical protein
MSFCEEAVVAAVVAVILVPSKFTTPLPVATAILHQIAPGAGFLEQSSRAKNSAGPSCK